MNVMIPVALTAAAYEYYIDLPPDGRVTGSNAALVAPRRRGGVRS
jgi:hypothetical protein